MLNTYEIAKQANLLSLSGTTGLAHRQIRVTFRRSSSPALA